MTSHYAVNLVMLGCVTATLGQEPAPPPPQSRREPAIGEIQITENIFFPKINGTGLGRLYQKFTGRRLLVSPAAATTEFSLVQKANPQHPITYKQASELVAMSARLENFEFVRDSKDPDLDVLTACEGIKAVDRGIPVFNNSNIPPDCDGTISYVMTLKYIAPDIAKKHFTRASADLVQNAYSSISVVPNASALVITDDIANIRRFIAIQSEIDRPDRDASE